MSRYASLFGIFGIILLLFGVMSGQLVDFDVYYCTPIHLVLGLICLILFFICGGLQILRTTAMKRAYGLGAGVLLYSFVFLGLVVLVNYFVARHDFLRYDSTEEKVFTLAPQSQQIVDKLQEPVIIRAFYRGGEVDERVRALLELFERAGTKISWTSIDLEKEPQLQKKYGVEEYGTLHFSFDDEKIPRATKVVGEIGEEQITNALIKLVRPNQKKVYFLLGHGERDLDNDKENGYSFLKTAIEGESIKVEPLHLGNQPKIPDDADAILVLAPEQTFLQAEQDVFEQYLENGGKAILFNEPHTNDQISRLARKWGIDVGNDIVIDQFVRVFHGPSLGVQPVVSDYGKHKITEGFNRDIVFSTASSVRAEKEKTHDGIVTELALSSPKSWAERKVDDVFSKNPQAELDPEDSKGPVSVAAAFEGKGNADLGKETRIVVFGDADFVANVNLGVLSNRDFILNAVSWVVGEEEGITIRPRTLRQSVKPVTTAQFSLIFLVGAILLPELILLSGFLVWWIRKN